MGRLNAQKSAILAHQYVARAKNFSAFNKNGNLLSM